MMASSGVAPPRVERGLSLLPAAVASCLPAKRRYNCQMMNVIFNINIHDIYDNNATVFGFFALACVSPTLLSSKLEICHFFDFGIVIYIRSGIGDCSLALTVIMASFQLLENFYLCQKIWVIYVSSTIQRLTQSHYLRRSAILHT